MKVSQVGGKATKEAEVKYLLLDLSGICAADPSASRAVACAAEHVRDAHSIQLAIIGVRGT